MAKKRQGDIERVSVGRSVMSGHDVSISDHTPHSNGVRGGRGKPKRACLWCGATGPSRGQEDWPHPSPLLRCMLRDLQRVRQELDAATSAVIRAREVLHDVEVFSAP